MGVNTEVVGDEPAPRKERLRALKHRELLDFVEARVAAYKKYENLNKALYLIGEVLILVLGAITTVSAAFSDSKILTTILAAATTLVAGLNKIAKARDRWDAYCAAHQELSESFDSYRLRDGEPSRAEKEALLASLEKAESHQLEAWRRSRRPDGSEEDGAVEQG